MYCTITAKFPSFCSRDQEGGATTIILSTPQFSGWLAQPEWSKNGPDVSFDGYDGIVKLQVRSNFTRTSQSLFMVI